MTEDPFSQLARHRLGWWFEYCKQSWHTACAPATLTPSRIISHPIAHNAASYRWVERRHKHSFLAIDRIITNTVSSSKLRCGGFSDQWRQTYDAVSVWKQIRPLLTFASMLGIEPDDRLHSLAAGYALFQGVPSMIADRTLDNDTSTSWTGNAYYHVPFSSLCTNYAFEIFQSMPESNKYVEVLFRYAREMYERMWNERVSRYKVPCKVTSKEIVAYSNGDSRLLSSVFHGICIEWAYLLSGRVLSPDLKLASQRLRRVRQLNDEIADIEVDVASGLCTLPVLIALKEQRTSNEIRTFLEQMWSTGTLTKQHLQLVDGCTNASTLRDLLNRANALERTALESLHHLEPCLQAFATAVPANMAFELTLLLNQRISFLLRLSRNFWREIDYVYYPKATISLTN